jgi:hypothetical protein
VKHTYKGTDEKVRINVHYILSEYGRINRKLFSCNPWHFAGGEGRGASAEFCPVSKFKEVSF